jgi:hypothetical protein
MIISDYIKLKFQTFGIQLSEADLLDISLGLDEEVTFDNKLKVDVAIAKFVPSLLLRAQSISESGFSMSWNIQGIKDYYSWACKQYGLKDELSNKPKVTFL